MMAGRKRKAGMRFASGDIQRRPRLERREDIMHVALAARQRLFGVSADLAKAEVETSFLGRLRVQGMAYEAERRKSLDAQHRGITQRQYDAAMKYREAKDKYDQLHMVRRITQAGDMDRGSGFDGSDGTEEDYLRQSHYWQRRFLRCQRALLELASVDVHARTITDNVVLNGYWMPAHIPSLRLGLNALAKAVGV